MQPSLFMKKVCSIGLRKADAAIGRIFDMEATLRAMALRPFELHLELTNLCNADCIFCPYHFQERPISRMTQEVFDKAVGDYVAEGGGSVFLTPIVGDALIHRGAVDFVRNLRSRPEIDRIAITSNCIMVDRFGAEALIASGLTHFIVSIAGFDEAMYRRVYRSKQYKRVFRNVLALLEANRQAGEPVNIVIALRPDRPLNDVMEQPDLKRVLDYKPMLDFTWSFTTAGGRVTREMLPPAMRIRRSPGKTEPCVMTYNGPMVLPDGTVMACNCVAAMDAVADLAIGDIHEQSLGDIWRASQMRILRESFGTPSLNPTCANCDMYRDLETYRTREGRKRAAINRRRADGEIVHRKRGRAAFLGG